MKLHLNRQRRNRGAFTLIELLVVIVILAALAALIVPNIGQYGRSTDMAVSAKTQADIANQAQLFFITQKRYPQGLDSLLDTTGALYASDSSNADTQTRGLPFAGADGTRLQAQLTVATLTPATTDPISLTNPDYFRSLTRSGFDWVFDHDITVVNSNTSNTTFRGLVANANGGVNTAPTTIAVAELTGVALLAKLVPQGLKAGERVVAFGFGQKSTAVGKTTTTVPLYPGADKTYYGRYVLYFKIYASGERATLVGVSDSYGRTPDYTEQQFNESLPDGARQG
jgi:prepilin-type N-terminal cleavage/methylation domain-containing protein